MPRILRPAVLAAVAALAAAAPAPAPAAALHRCSEHRQVHGRLGAIATVLDVRNTRCATARRTLRRHGRAAGATAFGAPGSKFELGRWRCTVFFAVEESHRARCVKGAKVFRIDYGS